MRVKCPGCARTLDFSDQYAGKKGKCPNCEHIITVPESAVERPVSGMARCTGCGKDVLLTEDEVVSECRSAGINLDGWAPWGPQLSIGLATAVGVHDIYELLRGSDNRKAKAFRDIIGKWAPSDYCCNTCGGIWCHECVNGGPLPAFAFGRGPRCKCDRAEDELDEVEVPWRSLARVGVLLTLGLVALVIVLGVRSCARNKRRRAEAFQPVITEVESKWEEWRELGEIDVQQRIEAPIVVIMCEFYANTIGVPIPGEPSWVQKSVWTSGLRRVIVKNEDLGYPTAKRAGEVKTLVVVLKNDPKGGYAIREGTDIYALDYLIIDWPSRTVLWKKRIPPIQKEVWVDTEPGALGGWETETRFYRSWDTLWQSVKESLGARIGDATDEGNARQPRE